MKVLIACEESQAVTIEFRKLGIEAFSCDIQECSGGHPEWHYQEDVFKVIDREQWDIMIAFPPCTYLTVTGARWMYNKDKSINTERKINQDAGLDFVRQLLNSNINYIALENPVGAISNAIRKPDQIIQPYYFGDQAQKTTCLWLKNLPPLFHSSGKSIFNEATHVSKGEMITTSTGKTFSKWYWETSKGKGKERQKLRSKTFPGIAKAMATQWTEYILSQKSKSA